MKYLKLFFIILSITNSNQIFGQNLVIPIDQFETPDSAIQFGTEIEAPRQLFIMNINPLNNNWLDFGFHQFSLGFQDNIHDIVMWSKRTMDVSTGEIIESKTESVQNSLHPKGNQSILFDTVHDASSIIMADEGIVLENAYTQNTLIEKFPDPHILNSALERAVVSPNQQWIGGMIRYSNYTVDVRLYIVSFPALWDSSGKVVFPNPFINRNPGLESYRAFNAFPTASEVKFSPDSQFFIARGLGNFNSIDTPNGPEAERTIPLPNAFMINTETLTEWDVDVDVAFTSDSRFFVTVRDGFPSLVSVNSNHVLQRYDIDDNLMLAATFSNDDQTLYIAAVEYSAAAEGTVYVFPSQLPTSHVQEWELSK